MYLNPLNASVALIQKPINLHTFCRFLPLCPYLELFQSGFSRNAGKYGPEKLRVRTLFTQGTLQIFIFFRRKQETRTIRILTAGFWVYSCQVFFFFSFFEKVIFLLVSVYSHASFFFFFLVCNFCIQEAAESRTITVCLLNMLSENRSTIYYRNTNCSTIYYVKNTGSEK